MKETIELYEYLRKSNYRANGVKVAVLTYL